VAEAATAPKALSRRTPNRFRTSDATGMTIQAALLINAAVTLIEPLPVGLLVTLVSAGILRRRTPAPAI